MLKFLFGKGFRIFFLIIPFFSVGLITIWILKFTKQSFISVNVKQGWHGHEMIFGFSVGIIAGFILTASENWIKHKIISTTNLIMLLNIWILGRVVNIARNSIPKASLLIIELSFIPILIVVIFHSIAGHKKSNLLILLITTLLATLNFFSYFEKHTNRYNIYFTSVIVIIMLILKILSQLLPTYGKFQKQLEIKTYRNINRTIIVCISSLIVANLLGKNLKIFPANLSIYIAIANIYQASGWCVRNSIKEPMLFILYISYYWIQIGFLFNSFSLLLNHNIKTNVLHILTIGGIGTAIIGMITRVSLGHSNKKIKVNNYITFAFASIIMSTIIRTLLPLIYPKKTNLLIVVSGVFWLISYTIFIIKHIVLLIKFKK